MVNSIDVPVNRFRLVPNKMSLKVPYEMERCHDEDTNLLKSHFFGLFLLVFRVSVATFDDKCIDLAIFHEFQMYPTVIIKE